MEEDKMMSFDCKRFMSLLDRYTDGELTKDEEVFFYAHASTCKNCDKELKIANMIKAAIRDVDDDIVVPLSAQSAWRSAVRKEIRRKKSGRAIKALTSVAAAFAVLVGTTFAMRGMGALPPVYTEETKGAAVNNVEIAVQSAGVMKVRSMPTEGNLVLESDGEFDSNATGSAIEAIYEEEIIRSAQRVAETEDYENDLRLLFELTEEYDGRIAEEYQNLALDQRSTTVVSQIPVDLMDEYLIALDNIGNTLSLDKVSEDASLIYYDLEGRLETKRETAERLNELISDADGETLVSLNSQLEQVYLEIDALESQRLQKENDISYARITVTLNEKLSVATVSERSTLSERSSEGFKQSANTIGRFFEDMVVSVAVIAPVLLILAAAVIVFAAVRFAVKKTGKKKSEEK